MITLKQLPTSVKLFVERCDAFIVGSAANPNAVLGEIRPDDSIGIPVNDIDVVTPFHKWDVTCIIIQKAIDSYSDAAPVFITPELNVYGGMKFGDWAGIQQITIDVWPSDLNKYLLSSLVEYVWNPKFNLRYVRCVNVQE